jgi:hypothetical protein
VIKLKGGEMPIGQLILEIRGCIEILGSGNILNAEFKKEQIDRAESLIAKYESFKPSVNSLTDRLWLVAGDPYYKILCDILTEQAI